MLSLNAILKTESWNQWNITIFLLKRNQLTHPFLRNKIQCWISLAKYVIMCWSGRNFGRARINVRWIKSKANIENTIQHFKMGVLFHLYILRHFANTNVIWDFSYPHFVVTYIILITFNIVILCHHWYDNNIGNRRETIL